MPLIVLLRLPNHSHCLPLLLNMADGDNPPSSAAELRLKHARAAHQPTVQEVPDEDMMPRASAAEASGSGPAPSWVNTPSAKSVGKQKAQEPAGGASTLDTQSHELFPQLGGPKPKPAAGAVPVWSAKSGVNGTANGATPTNGTPRVSTPAASGVSTPTAPALHGPPSLSIPGRNVETMYLEQHHVLARNQLKRPLPDIIKDVNRRSRATISMSSLPNGRLKFEATGPQDIAQQALKDLAQQIGTKVGRSQPPPKT